MDSLRDTIVRQAIESRAELADGGPGRFEGCSDPELASAIDFFARAGMADAMSGDVEAPCGFFARVERWLLIIDSNGFRTLCECDDVAQARSLFTALEHDYELWCDGDGGER